MPDQEQATILVVDNEEQLRHMVACSPKAIE